MQSYLVYTPVLGAGGLLLAVFLILGINRLTPGTVATNKNVVNISNLSRAFLNRYYIIATGVALVAFLIFGFSYEWPSALCFLVGVLVSLLLLNQTIVNLQQAGIRAANSAASSTGKAMAVLLCAGSVSGLLVMSVVLLGCGLLFFSIGGTPYSLSLFVLGVCLPAIFFAAAGNFFILSLKSKTGESGALQPEEYLTAKQISALLFSGTATLDLFGSCTAALAGAMSIGALGMVRYGFGGVLLPLLVFAVALLASMGILLLIIILRNQGWLKVTTIATCLFALFMLLFTLAASKYLLPGEQIKVFLSVVAGSGAAMLLLLPWRHLKLPPFLGNFNSYHLLISIPAILLALAFSYYISGFYGASLAALAVLIFTGVAVFIQTLEQMQNYSLGIVEITMGDEKPADMEKLYREIAAGRDSSEEPVACFNPSAAFFAAAALLLTFIQMAEVGEIPAGNGMVLLGLAIGGILPYLFSGWMAGEDRTRPEESYFEANENLEDEVTGEQKPRLLLENFGYHDYKESLLVLLLAAAIPLLTGFLLGKQVLAALLVGVVISGIILAILRVRNYSYIANLNLLIKFLLVISLTLAVPFLA